MDKAKGLEPKFTFFLQISLNQPSSLIYSMLEKHNTRERAHIFSKMLLPVVVNAVIHVFSIPRFILDQARPRPGQARPRPRPRQRSGQVMARPSLGQATPGLGLGLGLCLGLGLGLARPGQA